MAIDWGFISDLEGGQVLIGYVPNPSGSLSGVTIATGVDLGQMSTDEINHLAISSTMKSQLLPYAGMKGRTAADYLAQNPLTITKADADVLDQAIQAPTVSSLKSNYDGAVGTPGTFDGLPDQAQTVIASVAFQYGSNLAIAAPKFWGRVTAKDWRGAVAELRNFGDAYPTRRNKEADLLQQIVH